MTHRRWQVAAAWSLVLLAAATASAQSDESGARRRLSFDTVIGAQDMLLEDADWRARYLTWVHERARVQQDIITRRSEQAQRRAAAAA